VFDAPKPRGVAIDLVAIDLKEDQVAIDQDIKSILLVLPAPVQSGCVFESVSGEVVAIFVPNRRRADRSASCLTPMALLWRRTMKTVSLEADVRALDRRRPS
jgi:hypothetical protein